MKTIFIAMLLMAAGAGVNAQSCAFRNSTIWESGDACAGEAPLTFPNPANDVFTLNFPDTLTGEATVEIYDMMGRVIDIQKYASLPAMVTFRVGQLKTGFYFYQMQNNFVIVRGKFFKS